MANLSDHEKARGERLAQKMWLSGFTTVGVIVLISFLWLFDFIGAWKWVALSTCLGTVFGGVTLLYFIAFFGLYKSSDENAENAE
jgi:hypothetical protein